MVPVSASDNQRSRKCDMRREEKYSAFREYRPEDPFWMILANDTRDWHV